MTTKVTIIYTHKNNKAMKRDSKHFGYCREKLYGEKLYGRNAEPVLELCTDCFCIGYTGCAHYSVRVSM